MRLLDVTLLTYLVAFELNHCLEIPQQCTLEMIRQKLLRSPNFCEAPFFVPCKQELPVSFNHGKCDRSRNANETAHAIICTLVRPGHAMLMRPITKAFVLFVLCSTFENVALILQVRPTVHTKRSSNWRNLKTPALCFRVAEKKN